MIRHSIVRRAAALLAMGALGVSLAAGAGYAAPEGVRPGKVKAGSQKAGRMAAAFERLNLTAEQKARIQAIQSRRRAEVRSLRQSGGDKAARQGRMRELKAKYRAEIMGVLTREQQAQLKEARKKARAGRKGAEKA